MNQPPELKNKPPFRPNAAVCIFGILSLLLVIAAVMLRYTDWDISMRYFLMGGSTAFVLTAVAGGAWKSRYGVLILIAMILCWLGDFFGPGNFLLGAGFFLIGHFVLIAAFFVYGLKTNRLWYSIDGMFVVSGGLAYWILPEVFPNEQWFVASYITVISTMVALACATKGMLVSRYLAAGAILFFISDILLALNRYMQMEIDYTFFGYPIYYAACILFAISVAAYQHETHDG
jgi:uncharacterized membrane protein YhhN